MACAVAGLAALVAVLGPAEAGGLACPGGMVPVQGYCIDAYEAATERVAVDARGKVRALGRHSSFAPIARDETVRAVSGKGRTPQAHVSQEQAAAACKLAGKRLCTDTEWITACKGKRPTAWPYGDERVPGRCNDEGTSGINLLFGAGAEAPESAYTQTNMNDERLNRFPRSLAASGSRARCKSSYGAYDMVGNLHEWTSAGGGTFRGGYYLDVTINGEGCDYRTTAHSTKYFDYSTGFRCCWSPGDDKKRRAEESRLAAESKKALDAEKAEKAKAKAKADAEKTEAENAKKAARKKADAKKAAQKKADTAKADARKAAAEKKKKPPARQGEDEG